jgi:3D (Asp-Asp-Asp) domain-containing protein
LWLLDGIQPPANGRDAYAAWESPAAQANLRAMVAEEVRNGVRIAVQEQIDAIVAANGIRKVTVTAYTASLDECDDDPNNTAIMTSPRPGWTVAVSRDLLEDGWGFGRKVWIDGVGVREIGDVMNSRWTGRIDVLVGRKKEAKRFGVREDVVAVRIGG